MFLRIRKSSYFFILWIILFSFTLYSLYSFFWTSKKFMRSSIFLEFSLVSSFNSKQIKLISILWNFYSLVIFWACCAYCNSSNYLWRLNPLLNSLMECFTGKSVLVSLDSSLITKSFLLLTLFSLIFRRVLNLWVVFISMYSYNNHYLICLNQYSQTVS